MISLGKKDYEDAAICQEGEKLPIIILHSHSRAQQSLHKEVLHDITHEGNQNHTHETEKLHSQDAESY